MKKFFKVIFGIILIIIGLVLAPAIIGLYIIWIGWAYLNDE
jgi:hypothetical protein